jgi:ketosteroid isomerase-like protein
VGKEDVELVRKLYELWERREYAAAAEFIDPDIEFVRIGSEFADMAGEWRGYAQVWAAMTDYLRVWEDLVQLPERFIDLGDGVLVLLTQTGRGRRSGVVVEREVAFLFTARGGKVVRIEGYWDRDEGLRAAGLEA